MRTEILLRTSAHFNGVLKYSSVGTPASDNLQSQLWGHVLQLGISLNPNFRDGKIAQLPESAWHANMKTWI